MKKDDQITAVVERLREFRSAERGERIRDTVMRWIEDPLKPKTAAGRIRLNPILLLSASLAAMVGGTFLFFRLVAP